MFSKMIPSHKDLNRYITKVLIKIVYNRNLANNTNKK